MERLTHRRKLDGAVCPNIRESKVLTDFADFTQKVYDKLAAYEDTGLTPEEIVNLAAMREMTPEQEYVIDKYCTKLTAAIEDIIEQEHRDAHTEELLKAEEQGLLVRLPCKVGDTVYTESHIKGAITSFSAPDETWIFENRAEFGKTVFLTREEAEAALAKEG